MLKVDWNDARFCLFLADHVRSLRDVSREIEQLRSFRLGVSRSGGDFRSYVTQKERNSCCTFGVQSEGKLTTNQFAAMALRVTCASVILGGCVDINDTARKRSVAPDVAVLYSEPGGVTANDMAISESDALESPTSREVERNYSVAAARGEVPLYETVPTRLTEYTNWNIKLKEIPAKAPTKNAELEPISLSEAVTAGIANSLEAAQAAEALNKAEVQNINAFFGLLPQVFAVGEYSRVQQDVIESDNAVFQAGATGFNVVTGRIEAVQPILDLPALLSYQASRTAKSASERAYISAVQNAAFQTASSYLLALQAQARLDSAGERVELLNQQVGVEDNLIEFGLSTPASRQLLEVQIGQTEIERLQFREDYDAAAIQLGRLIGQPTGVLSDVSVSAESKALTSDLDANALVTEAIKMNPQAQQLRLQTLQQRQLLNAELAEDFFPQLEGFGRVEYEDRAASRFGGGSETLDATLGVRLTVPIFNANGTGYGTFEQHSDLRAASLSEAQLRRSLEVEIRSLVNRLRAQNNLIAKADTAYSAAQELLKSAYRSVESGVATDLIVLRHKVQLANAKEWRARINYSFLRNAARLSFLTGKPIEL